MKVERHPLKHQTKLVNPTLHLHPPLHLKIMAAKQLLIILRRDFVLLEGIGVTSVIVLVWSVYLK